MQALRPDPDHAEIADVAYLFKLLGDPTRLKILYAIVETGELCVCDLAPLSGPPRRRCPTHSASCAWPASCLAREPYRYTAELSVGCEKGSTHIDPCAQDVRVVEVERWRAERPGRTADVDQRSDSHDRE